jgi:MSHA biogenesis protein MshJ
MKRRWKAMLARYDALTQRERALVAAAVVGGVLLVGNSLFVDLPMARASLFQKQMLAEQSELQALQLQIGKLQSEIRDPDEDNRNRLKALRVQQDELQEALARHEKLLVSPGQITTLLEQLLTRHASLRLVSLRSLPVVPAGPTEEVPVPPGNTGEKALPQTSAGGGNDVWKHGVEVRLQGSYADLAAYVAELEKLPQRLVWGEVSLTADYPKAE